jgi:hypothetical protein
MFATNRLARGSVHSSPRVLEGRCSIGWPRNIRRLISAVRLRCRRRLSGETADEEAGKGAMTPDEIIEKLEQRVGPKGRELFEQFLRKVNKLHAQQYLEAQARTVENRGGDRGR